MNKTTGGLFNFPAPQPLSLKSADTRPFHGEKRTSKPSSSLFGSIFNVPSHSGATLAKPSGEEDAPTKTDSALLGSSVTATPAISGLFGVANTKLSGDESKSTEPAISLFGSTPSAPSHFGTLSAKSSGGENATTKPGGVSSGSLTTATPTTLGGSVSLSPLKNGNSTK